MLSTSSPLLSFVYIVVVDIVVVDIVVVNIVVVDIVVVDIVPINIVVPTLLFIEKNKMINSGSNLYL
jgi:hypothetical protein